MKTKEEIEQLAIDIIKTRFNETAGYHKVVYVEAYVRAYLQCQEDMADKKYTEEDVIKLMGMATRWDTFKDGDVEYGMDMDEFFDYIIKQVKK